MTKIIGKVVGHDSRDSKRGDFYQTLVALKYALSEKELFNFKTLTIEHHGDVSFDNIYQIETKHHKSTNSLGDTNEEFWKTLYNWLKQDLVFEKLILHTTSHFPTRTQSLLRKWNKSTIEEKNNIIKKIKFDYSLDKIKNYKITEKNIEILKNLGIKDNTIELVAKAVKEIKKKCDSTIFNTLLNELQIEQSEKEILLKECKDTASSNFKIWNYSRYVKSCSISKLENILAKTIIKEKQANDTNTIKEISEFPIFIGACKSEGDFDTLIREKIAGPIASKVVGDKKWDTNKKQFYNIINDAKSLFHNEKYKPIFDKYLKEKPSTAEFELNAQKKFVTELGRIKCEKHELKDAIVDYWKTNSLIGEELDLNPFFTDDEYKPYKEEIIYKKVRNKKLMIPKSESRTTNLDNSLLFYRQAKDMEFQDSKNIRSFQYFTHGTLHNIVEDNTNDFNWMIDD